jgi:hypothetical protein
MKRQETEGNVGWADVPGQFVIEDGRKDAIFTGFSGQLALQNSWPVVRVALVGAAWGVETVFGCCLFNYYC